jgi:hypothetical protein
MGDAHTVAAHMVATCTVASAKEVPFTVTAAVEAAEAIDMVKNLAVSSNCDSAEADEAGAANETGHRARHVFHLFPLLFFLFRRSPEFALGRAC